MIESLTLADNKVNYNLLTALFLRHAICKGVTQVLSLLLTIRHSPVTISSSEIIR